MPMLTLCDGTHLDPFGARRSCGQVVKVMAHTEAYCSGPKKIQDDTIRWAHFVATTAMVPSDGQNFETDTHTHTGLTGA